MKKNLHSSRFQAVAADGAVDWDHPLNANNFGNRVAWWHTPPGVPATGSRLLDLCGRYHGTFGTTTKWQSVNGFQGASPLYDGTANSPISTLYSTGLVPPVSMAAWVNISNIATAPRTIFGAGAGSDWLQLRVDQTTGTLTMNLANDTGLATSTGALVKINVPVRVGASYDAVAGLYTFTANGLIDSSGIATGTVIPLPIILGQNAAAELMTGLMWDVTFWNYILTPQEWYNDYLASVRGYMQPDSPLRWFSTRTWFAPLTGIAFDAASNSGNQSAVSSVSFSVPWNGSNRMLTIDVPFMGAAGTVSTITYGGATCTLIGAQNVVGGTGRIEQWRICQNDSGAPAAGANTLVVTYSGVIADTSVNCVSYTNVNQSLPTEAWNGNSGINAGTGTNATVVVTPIADKTWIHYGLATSQTSGIASSNTSRNIVTGAGGTGADSDSGAQITPASAQTGTWTGEGITAAWATAGYAIRPTSASGPAYIPYDLQHSPRFQVMISI
jgi:hypothetical protein